MALSGAAMVPLTLSLVPPNFGINKIEKSMDGAVALEKKVGHGAITPWPESRPKVKRVRIALSGRESKFFKVRSVKSNPFCSAGYRRLFFGEPRLLTKT